MKAIPLSESIVKGCRAYSQAKCQGDPDGAVRLERALLKQTLAFTLAMLSEDQRARAERFAAGMTDQSTGRVA